MARKFSELRKNMSPKRRAGVELKVQRELGRIEASARVESWRDELLEEANGGPFLLIVGAKVLEARDIFTNMAIASRSFSGAHDATDKEQG